MLINDNYRVERRTINLYKSHVDGMTLIQHNDTMLIFDILGLDKAPFTIEIILLHAVRSDGKKYVQEHNIAINGNELIILLEPRIVDIPGDVAFQLVFMDENGITISSHIFRANVKPMLINGQSTAPPASEIMNMMYISSRAPEIDAETRNWKVYDNASGQMVVTDYPSQGSGSEVDTEFDVNSNNAIANKTVTEKFSDVDDDIGGIKGDITAIDTRVTSLEQSGGGGSVAVDTALDINSNNAIANNVVAAKFIGIDEILQDFADRITALERNSTELLITTTETADTLTIQQNPNDTSFYAMTIYGKTTSPSGMALQTGTPSPDNPAPIVGVTNPVITVSDGTKTQSITLDGITLHSIDAASLIDTIEIDNGKVTLTHRVAVMTDLNLFSIYPSGTTTTHTSIYIPTNEYLLGASNVYCNLLPNTDIGGNGYVTTAIAQNRIFISNVPNALTGINGSDTSGNKLNALKAWLLARGIKILYVPKVATVTDITDLPVGQALLGLHGYKGTTVIQFSGGATGNITYNRSATATIAEVNAALTALLGGQDT